MGYKHACHFTAASARQGSRDAAAHMGDQSTGPQGGAAAVLPGPTRLPVQARPTQTVEDLRVSSGVCIGLLAP